MWRTRQAVAAAVLLAAAGMTHAWGQRLFFFDEDGGGGRPRGCYVFDVAIGTSTLLFEVPLNVVIDSMTLSRPGLIVLAVDSAAETLYQVDLGRGRIEFIRTLGVDGITGIAQRRYRWGAYTITNRGDLYWGSRFLGSIAPVTAGLTFSPDGTLYGFDGANGDLYSVEPSNPSRRRLGGSGDPIGPITDATATWDGELFVADHSGALFRVSLDGRRTRVGTTGLGDGLLGLAPQPTAPLLEDFESYVPGDLCEQSLWEEFPDRQGMDACGTVAREYAHSGVQSLRIVGDPGGKFGFGDHVSRRKEIFGGLWNYSVWTFVPESATGDAYVMVWSDRDLTRTSLRLRLDADNDLIVSEPGGETLPLLRGRWVEVWADFNLGPQTVSISYDGVALVSNGSWDGEHRIEAVSFYAGEPGGGTSGIYLDDVLVYPVDECEPCDINCDASIDVFDIQPFLDCLFGACDPCSLCAGDANRDGVVDAFDITRFLECLFP